MKKMNALRMISGNAKEILKPIWLEHKVKTPKVSIAGVEVCEKTESIMDSFYGKVLYTRLFCPTHLDRLKCIKMLGVDTLRRSFLPNKSKNTKAWEKNRANYEGGVERYFIEDIAKALDKPEMLVLYLELVHGESEYVDFVSDISAVETAFQANYYLRNNRLKNSAYVEICNECFRSVKSDWASFLMDGVYNRREIIDVVSKLKEIRRTGFINRLFASLRRIFESDAEHMAGMILEAWVLYDGSFDLLSCFDEIAIHDTPEFDFGDISLLCINSGRCSEEKKEAAEMEAIDYIVKITGMVELKDDFLRYNQHVVSSAVVSKSMDKYNFASQYLWYCNKGFLCYEKLVEVVEQQLENCKLCHPVIRELTSLLVPKSIKRALSP